MFCPYCGTNLPDNSQSCSACGASLTPAEPTTQVPPTMPTTPAPIVSKNKYFSTMATPKIQTFSRVAWIVAIVLIVALVGSYFAVLNTSFEKIPVVSLALSAAGADEDEIDEAKDAMKELVEEAEDTIEIYEDELSSGDRKLIEKALKVMEDCADSISLNNINRLSDVADDIVDIEVDGANVFEDEFDSIQEDLEEMLSAISGVILGAMIFVLIFSALGGLLRIRGLVITGLVFSVLYTLIFCGVLWLLLIVLIHSVLIYLLSQMNAEYKAYHATAFIR